MISENLTFLSGDLVYILDDNFLSLAILSISLDRFFLVLYYISFFSILYNDSNLFIKFTHFL
jgi:hypothetical protein